MGNCLANPQASRTPSPKKAVGETQGKEMKKPETDHLAYDPDDIRRHYRLGDVIGKGAFGFVQVCTFRDTGEECAVKIVEKGIHASGLDCEKMMRSELYLLSTLDHPNVVQYYDFFEDDKFFYAVMELCTGGELFKEIQRRQSFSEENAANLCRQMCAALEYCHSKSIMHRDVKAENFLFKTTGEDAPLAMIDFGFAVHFESGDTFDQVCGSPRYVAPEVLNKHYDEKADLWSLGVIIYLLLYGKYPFGRRGASMKEIVNEVKTLDIDYTMPEGRQLTNAALDFIASLLDRNPKTRMSAKEALNHPWICTDEAEKRQSIIGKDVLRAAFDEVQEAQDALDESLYQRRLETLKRMQESFDKSETSTGRRLYSLRSRTAHDSIVRNDT